MRSGFFAAFSGQRARGALAATVLIGAGWAGLAAGPALAKLSLKQKQYAKAQDEQLAEELKYTNEKCETKITASIDWKTFEGTEAFDEKYSVSGYCAPAVNGVRYQCEKDELGKAAAKEVKSVTCVYAAKDKRSISLQKGKLVYGVEFGAANADDYVRDFLLKELSLGEKRQMDYEQTQLKGELDYTNKQCGKELAYEIDWKSFQKGKFTETNYSVHGYCDGVLSGLESVCADPDGKAAVAESITKLVCVLGKKDEKKLALKKGVLTFTVGWDAANTGDFAKEWLLENL